MTAPNQVDTLIRAAGTGGVAFGALATLAPKAFLAAYGVRDRGAALEFMTRAWGTRSAVLGALTIVESADPARKRLVTAVTVMDAVDALLLLRSGLPAKTRIMGALTSGAFAVVGATVLSRMK
jgi:hypothetical protein